MWDLLSEYSDQLTFLPQNIALLQKDVKSLEEELGEARAAVEEAGNKETEWKAIKSVVSLKFLNLRRFHHVLLVSKGGLSRETWRRPSRDWTMPMPL